jgi:transposase
MAARLCLMSTQHSSGRHARLGEISCCGDGYVRSLLLQGARSTHHQDNTLTSSGPQAQGKSIMRPLLTRSLLRNG